MDHVQLFILFIVVTSFALGLPKLLSIGRRPANYPPGPPTLPVLGNLHQIPKDKPHEQFTKWAQEYGPVYSLILGTKTFIVISSDVVVKELLDKRSNIYSSRPSMYIGQDVASGGYRIVLMQLGERWRKLFKILHSIFTIRAVVTYLPYQDLENKQVLLDMVEKPDDFIFHLRRYTNSLITQMVFGFRTTSNNDPKLRQLFKCFDAWGRLVQGAGAQLLDIYPILRKLPAVLRPNYRYAQRLHKIEMQLFRGHWMDAKKRLLEGTGKPCFCSDLLKAQEQENMSDEQAAYLTGSLLEAGSDTTASTLIGFIQAMMVFPEVQEKLKEEIDRVVGHERLPEMADEPNLPYVRGCVKEALRWMPTIILGVPHCVTQDDEYLGYKIPADATVILNVWGIHMDPKRHHNPRVFDPSRYANDPRSEFESAMARDVSKRGHFVFGAGRRLCPGMRIAERSLFLAISRIIWAFDIKRPIDPTSGKEMPLPDIDDLVGGITVQPAPFKADIKPRSEKKELKIRQIWQQAEDSLLDTSTKQWREIPEGMRFSTYTPIRDDELPMQDLKADINDISL